MDELETHAAFISNCRTFIEMLGANAVIDECNANRLIGARTGDITLQRIDYWKRQGIPEGWALFLKHRFPETWAKCFVHS